MNRYALVVVIGALVISTSVLAYGNQPDARPLDPIGWALLAATALGLLWRRERAEIGMVVCCAAAAAYFALGYAYAFWPAPALIMIFTVISAGRRRWGWPGAAFLVGVPALAVLAAHPGDDFGGSVENVVALLIWGLMVVVVVQLAEVSSARRAYTAEVERRAGEAERTREEAALRRAQEERLKVARELHDVTSHTVSLIALHAAVAAEALERAGGPEEARAALTVIRTASREALTEMKDILSILRTDGGGPEGEEAARRPVPGTGRLPDLVAGAGLPVELSVTGAARPLPAAIDLTVYRVIQEALTNTIRHAGANRAWVALRFETDGLVVQIDDDGRGERRGLLPRLVGGDGRPGGGTGGHGLAGMAERVAAVGGRLSTGDGTRGGFGVAAWLPLAPASPEPTP
ncbi:histidine kinase [Spongiactinospora sp. TRM90649]|uniref:sensor histidine kinase n=1 Tax=Spongiactinospora sp. TRM90649 TaxID=3031114 RepID=UPI0023F8E281|nr:histidine kinase [Spongiactinospora sp. TRM90649]MDF5753329.1 histidine kinase [Spongiactinospora sp. TRM90649]